MSWKFTELNFPKHRKIVYLKTGHYKEWKINNRLPPKLTLNLQYVALPDTLPMHMVYREINGNEIVAIITVKKNSF